MSPFPSLIRFARDEDGAAVVEGLAITGLIVAMSLALTAQVGLSAQDHAEVTAGVMDHRGVPKF